MKLQTESEARALLTGAVAPEAADPGILNRALKGGRRRLRRRRAALALVPVGLVLAGLAVATGPGLGNLADQDPATRTTVPPPDPSDPYRRLMDIPARGDLLHDKTYTAQVLTLVAEAGREPGAGLGRFLGPGRIVYAGHSPAGPTAVVVQRTELRPDDPASGGVAKQTTLLGFVGVDRAGRPKVHQLYAWPAEAGSPPPGYAWFVDEQQTVLGVLDPGRPVGYGTSWAYGSDGSRSVPLAPLAMHDGAGFARLPQPGPRGRINEVAVTVRGRPPERIPIEPVTGFRPWSGFLSIPDGLGLTDGLTTGPQLRKRFQQTLDERTSPLVIEGRELEHFAAGLLPDGTAVVVGESHLPLDDTRVTAALLPAGSGAPTVWDVGWTAPESMIPRINIRLPGSRGWVVIDDVATISWRSGAGKWSEPRQGGLLVPAAATEVRISRPGQAPKVVPLS